MQYEVTDVRWISAPVKKEGDPTKVEVYTNVTTGVVGDTYGFTRTDTFKAECDISLTGTQMEADVVAQATAYSQSLYPNTV
jgi:regulation of enolase protein 1 (concanavalin A-like superfamily)